MAEGLRKDETEGIVRGAWRLPNPVYFERSSMNNYYILCTSHPETDSQVLAEFGSYVVRINNPGELLKRIETTWQRHPLASGRCTIAPVVYDKDTLLDPTPGLLPLAAYSYSQKPKSFEAEREWRYVLTCTADLLKLKALVGEGLPLEDYLTLHLPDCRDICSMK